MARGRMLQNRISKSKKLAELSSDTVRLLYTWMLSHLDVNGNFYADPVMVNNIVFTRLNKSANDVQNALDELEQEGLIERYQINDEIYLKYPDFHEKQPKIQRDREASPEIPDKLKSNSRVTHTQDKIREDNIYAQKEALCAMFNKFWDAYPKKRSKGQAEKVFKKLKPDDLLLKTILEKLELLKLTDDWKKDKGQFIPYPATWLNAKGWEDEIEAEKKSRWS